MSTWTLWLQLPKSVALLLIPSQFIKSCQLASLDELVYVYSLKGGRVWYQIYILHPRIGIHLQMVIWRRKYMIGRNEQQDIFVIFKRIYWYNEIICKSGLRGKSPNSWPRGGAPVTEPALIIWLRGICARFRGRCALNYESLWQACGESFMPLFTSRRI